MIQVARLFEQEDVAETDEKQGGGNAVKQPQGDQQGQQAQSQEMPIHAVASPRRHPVKPEVAKMELRLDPALAEIPHDHPQHEQPK